METNRFEPKTIGWEYKSYTQILIKQHPVAPLETGSDDGDHKNTRDQ